MQKNQLVNLISEEDIKKITEAYKAMINAQKKSVELTGSWNSRFSTEQIGTYNKTISDLAEKVGVYSKALGVSERSANDAKRAIQNNGMALATRNMMIITNSYLEDIRKYNKLTYEEFGSKLDDIKRSLKNL